MDLVAFKHASHKAKSLDSNEWVYGSFISIGGRKFIVPYPFTLGDGEEENPLPMQEFIGLQVGLGGFIQVDGETVCRNLFLGGNKVIYENDILNKGGYFYKVSYEYGSFIFDVVEEHEMENDNNVLFSTLSYIDEFGGSVDDYEVVGNAHD